MQFKKLNIDSNDDHLLTVLTLEFAIILNLAFFYYETYNFLKNRTFD